MGIRPVNRGVVKRNEAVPEPAPSSLPIRYRTDYIRHASPRPRGVPDSRPCSEPPMPCRKGNRGGNALLCFVLGFVASCVCGGRIACFFWGGPKVRVMTWHLKNPVPPKAWGSGGEAPGSTTFFNIDIHINIDCQFGISNPNRSWIIK